MAGSRIDWVHRMGGVDVLRAVLRDFYDRLFVDPLVGFFFAGRDKPTLVERQVEFTARALGHDIGYAGRSVPEAHAALPPILPGHFDRRHKLLADAIAAHSIANDVRGAWLTYDRSFRRAVLGAKAGLRKREKT